MLALKREELGLPPAAVSAPSTSAQAAASGRSGKSAQGNSTAATHSEQKSNAPPAGNAVLVQ